ncbi:MAG: thioredoxin family protein [Planctomycetota bacterium]
MRVLSLRRQHFRTGLFNLTVAIAAVASSGSAVWAEITWHQDLRAAHQMATEQNKPLLLHFYSDNCIWCDRLEEGAFTQPSVGQAVNDSVIAVKVHAGQAKELAEMFQVRKFPTDVIVTPEGDTLSHGVSPQDPQKYIAMLTTAASKHRAALGAPVDVSPATPHPTTPNPPSATPPAPTQVASTTPRQPAAGMSFPGGATAQLAGARTDGMTLGAPNAAIAQAPAASEPASPVVSTAKVNPAATDLPDLAMEGYCAITVIDENRWAEGNPKHGVIHLGKLYMFETEAKMAKFLADPSPYTPVLNEIDVVRFFEERKIVPGKREFGVMDPIHHRMFFFADEAARVHFENEYQRYSDSAIEVMERAVRDANPNAG